MMMLVPLLLLVLICSVVDVSSTSPRRSATPSCWVAPHGASARNRGKSKTTARSSSSASSSSSLLLADRLNGNNNANGYDRAPAPSNGSEGRPPVPFIIQKIGRGTKGDIEEISRMCVDVFFNGRTDDDVDENGKRTPPWKALQLAYLRNFQEGDILARNAFKKDQLVDLVVARRVFPVSSADAAGGDPTLYDERQIYNPPKENGRPVVARGYAAGEIIGYSEVSEKNFGLGGDFDANQSRTNKRGEKPRPYLSNLSVAPYARRSGVGSALLDACEEAVRDWNVPDHREIVLQVEEDNRNAIAFYEGRGWEFVFADPTCRRYDTSGFLLRERRITKNAMVKRLDDDDDGKSGGEDGEDEGSFLQKLRNSFFVQ